MSSSGWVKLHESSAFLLVELMEVLASNQTSSAPVDSDKLDCIVSKKRSAPVDSDKLDCIVNKKRSAPVDAVKERDDKRMRVSKEVGDDNCIAFAAHAAAQVISESDAAVSEHPQQVVCRICGVGDGKPVLRFLSVEHDPAVATASPRVISFTQDICLHIFCGKTASFFSAKPQPELEILTEVGLKRKLGIEPGIHAALMRTRCAIRD
jgi:hypothetical protein